MSVPTCAVVCIVHDEDGTPSVGATVTAKLSSYEVDKDPDLEKGGYIAPMNVSGTTDDTGRVTLDLWPNQRGSVQSVYQIKITSENGKRLTTTAVIPEVSTVFLHQVSLLPPYEGMSDGELALEAAIEAGAIAVAAAEEARVSADEAAASATLAANSATDAGNFATSSYNFAVAASASADQAAASAAGGSGSAAAAAGSATAAQNSANAASASASAAAASAAQAASSATNAQTAADTAVAAAQQATTVALNAQAAATAAAASANAADASEANALLYAQGASVQATIANNAANAAEASADLAALRATDAVNAANAAAASASTASAAATTASNAATTATTAATTATNAAASASADAAAAEIDANRAEAAAALVDNILLDTDNVIPFSGSSYTLETARDSGRVLYCTANSAVDVYCGNLARGFRITVIQGGVGVVYFREFGGRVMSLSGGTTTAGLNSVVHVFVAATGRFYLEGDLATTTTEQFNPRLVLPLTNSLLPTLTYGSPNPTFTRASTAYVTDYAGMLRPVRSGEARFTGARRVRNLIYPTSSENLSGWQTVGGALVMSPTELMLGPFPEDFAYAESDAALVIPANSVFRLRARVSCASGTEKFRFGVMQMGLGIVYGPDITVYPTPMAYTALITLPSPSSNGALMALVNASVGGLRTITVTNMQMENVTGMGLQTPSEYVSTGVLAAPFHGAGVDGVRYFGIDNKNKVIDGNTILEIGGAPFADTVLLGYLAEGARTNLLLQSQSLDNAAWVKTTMTATPDATTAPDGTPTADALTASAGDGTVKQAVTAASATYTFSIYLKRLTGSGNVDLTLDNGVSWSTKAITALGWTRHSITQTLANPAAGFRIAVNGDAVYAWGAQVEAASFLSSYIPTTIAAATRAADSLSYAAAGHLSVLQPYSIYGEATPTQVAQTATLVASNVNYAPMFRSVGFSPGYPDFYSDNGVNFAIAQNAVVPGVTSKIAATMDGTNVLIAHAGIAGTWMARGSLTAEPTALYIGRQPAQGWEAYGNIRNVKTYPYALTPEQMLEMTAATVVEAAPTEPYDMTTFYPAPPKASAVMLRVAVVRALGFAANFAGSLAVASIGFPATAQAVFLITKNGTTIGTITFAAGAIVGVFASVGGLAQTLAVTDILAIIAPATPDATLSEIGFTLAATRAAALAA